VAVVEAAQLGGTCVNVGCIPKKLLSHAAHFSQLAEEARGFGWQLEQPRFDWPTLIANKDREIERLNGVYGRMLAGAGITLIHGRAALSGPHSVLVNGQTIHARHILIATGGTPSLPDIPGVEHAISSDEAFHLPHLPRRWWSWAEAISPWSSPPSSTAWAPRRPCCTAASSCCAALMQTWVCIWARRWLSWGELPLGG
jgi:glutathione reductase (NADPH)